MTTLPTTASPPVLRTDFSDPKAWFEEFAAAAGENGVFRGF